MSEVANLHSGKVYCVSTCPEMGQDYWSTVLMPVIEKRTWFGLSEKAIPDFYHPVANWVQNCKEDAYETHARVRFVVISVREDEWFDRFPPSPPPDGLSPGAKAKLRAALGDAARVD